MADAKFAFLRPAWGIELTAAAMAEIRDQAESLNRSDVEAYIKDSDLRKLGHTSDVPKEITRIAQGTVPPGKYMAQVQTIVDITQPTKFQEDFEGGKWRLLAVELASGDQKFKGIEYQQVKALGVHLPPGTKVVLCSSEHVPLQIQNGMLLLTPETVQVLGGHVERLVESWSASKEVEATRLLWRTEGMKKNAEGGAPPWIDFDPRKARCVGAAAQRRAAEEERAEWRKGGATKSAELNKKEEKDEDDGPRFKVSDFAEGDAPKKVKTQITANAFTKDPNAPKPKGEGKGKGKGKSADDGGFRRSRRDDDWEEEKRAPQAVSSLAAFIKPSKQGELPDEAISLLTGQSKASSAAAGAAGAASWEASWEGSAWEGNQGWSGSTGGASWSSNQGGGFRSSKGGRGGKGGKGGGGKGSRNSYYN